MTVGSRDSVDQKNTCHSGESSALSAAEWGNPDKFGISGERDASEDASAASAQALSMTDKTTSLVKFAAGFLNYWYLLNKLGNL